MKIFSNILNKHAPVRPKTKKEWKRNVKPWITNEILELSKTKAKLYSICLKGKPKDIDRML